MKRANRRNAESPHVHRLTADAQLSLSDANTLILVVRGTCAIRGTRQGTARLEAGSFVLRQGASAAPIDKRIARALGLLRAEPAKPWTVEGLARAVGLSRAAFARRFAEVSGRTPRRFLTDLRLALAATLLETTDESLAELAAHVGYASEFAFSRAFKRWRGVAPGAFRRSHRSLHSNRIRLAA